MPKDWQAVAEAVNTRMAELELSQKGLAEAARVGVATVRRLQKGEPAERGGALLAAVSVALSWPPGHLEAIAAGQPGPVDPAAALRVEVEKLRAEWEQRLAEWRQRVAEWEQRLAEEVQQRTEVEQRLAEVEQRLADQMLGGG
ncbi:transcriptional regulator with XRE-family HTH domain [Lentzea nigeriaca]|uniref:XRE family transcriptional regulator n=1 Tax=Lentzea nigeriaca TaxID=1128665 RepID=UPI00195DACA7|nr:XRE family transcriptional regulator [Lentzea nigeriaca]MBM7861893.1 transcriptional regulator with XRE-family HTH domain [Lentzea nigeriaca]